MDYLCGEVHPDAPLPWDDFVTWRLERNPLTLKRGWLHYRKLAGMPPLLPYRNDGPTEGACVNLPEDMPAMPRAVPDPAV